MASAADLRELESLSPFAREDFRAGLQALSASTAEASRRFAQDMRVLAELQAQVPRCAFDDRGATPWTSFRREVAVARSVSDLAAGKEIAQARMLAQVLPRMMALLQAGAVTVQRARAYVEELGRYDDDLAGLVDAELAERAAGLPVWRIEQEVRQVAARLDADAAALRVAAGNAGRGVILQPLPDDQAAVVMTGPAVPLTRWYATLDARARALKAAGDPRRLDQLRFDLAVGGFPCGSHPPVDSTATEGPAGRTAAAGAPPEQAAEDAGPRPPDAEAVHVAGDVEDAAAAAAGLRPSFVEPAATDCRRSRPVQASINVPVETSLGLSNDPAWLDGYGWISAPTARQLLVDAELRRVAVQARTGQLVDLDTRDLRPPPTPAQVRQSLLDMVLDPVTLTGSRPACRTEHQHDPSPPLRELVALRDRFCDGPTGTRTPARRVELDHDLPWRQQGPTAAWNLAARSTRTHQLKHYGWTPLRTPTAVLWFSPAGQVVEVPRHQQPPPGPDRDPDGCLLSLPDADQLHDLERAQLQPRADDDSRPWIPAEERDTTGWGWLDDDPPF